MENEKIKVSWLYIMSVSVMTFLVPVVASVIEVALNDGLFSFAVFGKWFIFSAVGLRLFIAGIKQATDPAFTAKQIFHITTADSHPIVRELGFSNICFGLVGIASLFFPGWRVVSAFGSGLYYGIAGAQHVIKKPAGINEWLAFVTDILIFVFLLVYFVKFI